MFIRKQAKTDINPEAIYLSRAGIYSAILRMGVFMILALAMSAVLGPTLKAIFGANRALNGLILFTFAFGLFVNFRNAAELVSDTGWLNDFFAGRERARVPGVIAPVAFLLREHRKNHRPYMEAGTMRTLLDIVESRISDRKASSNYFTGVLVFIGLLGTFWGLLMTIGSVGDVVRNLNISGGGVESMFESLKLNIAKPLSGMSTAFSTSLFGLAASLALGFLQLQSNLAAHSFLNELEENMTRYTRLASSSGAGDGAVITYLQAMLEQTADSVAALSKTVAKAADTNADVAKKMSSMSAEVAKLSKEMQEKLKAMERMSAGPEKLAPVLSDLVKISKSGFGMDDRTRDHIKSIDFGLADMTDKLSSDIRLLAKTIAMGDNKNRNEKRSQE
ncbi:MAG: hypothetical protein LBO78_02145 [Rickettsiales bacterium]|jgi:hypothetical protein|nr:hypothetical protein [Rickettsiales bacterium]